MRVSLVRTTAAPGADEVFASLRVEFCVEKVVCPLSALSFVNSPFSLLLPIVGVGSIVDDDGEDIRGRDARVEDCNEDSGRDRFRSDIVKFSAPNSMPTTD